VLRAGPREDEYWDRFRELIWKAQATVDLSGADLRGANLDGAKFQAVKLDGADLREASAHSAELGDLRGVNFAGASLENVYLQNAEGCDFRKADLRRAWLDFGSSNSYTECDFTDARLAQFQGQRCQFAGSVFEGANLSDGQVEGSDFFGAYLKRADLSRLHGAESKFDATNLAGAVLFRADLRKASLVNADLRRADLRGAVLSGADLTGARIAGADFAGAMLTGAKTAGLNVSRARNFHPPAARVVGPKIRELARAAGTSKEFVTRAEVDLGKGEHATLTLFCGGTGQNRFVRTDAYYHPSDLRKSDWIDAPTFAEGLFNLAERWPRGKLRLDSVWARGCRTPRGQKLHELAKAAWAEAFGLGETSSAL
jgi:uncharacterized protein YjbI with pentapeptide repeats